MDKLIKYELGIEYYGRYMDDFYLIHPSKECLKHCLEVITMYLETLDLELNGKTQIFPFKNGVSYLGFHTYVAPGGKVIRRLKNQNKRNAQRKYIRMAKMVVSGDLSLERFEASYEAWKNHIFKGNCFKLGRAMDQRIEEVIYGKQGRPGSLSAGPDGHAGSCSADASGSGGRNPGDCMRHID